MNYKLEYEIEGLGTYVVLCKPLTQFAAEQMAEDTKDNPDDESNIVVRYGFKSFTLNGEDIDWKDLPIEILSDALDKHPSFRSIG